MLAGSSPGCSVLTRVLALLQVLWRGPLGDQQFSGAAVPGPLQRAGAEVCNGWRVPGSAGQLPGEAVSSKAGDNPPGCTLESVASKGGLTYGTS